jgi:hypothetical protein
LLFVLMMQLGLLLKSYKEISRRNEPNRIIQRNLIQKI